MEKRKKIKIFSKMYYFKQICENILKGNKIWALVTKRRQDMPLVTFTLFWNEIASIFRYWDKTKSLPLIFSLSVKLQGMAAHLPTLIDPFCSTRNFRRKEPRKEEEAGGGEEEKGGQTRTMQRSTLCGAFPLFCPLSKLAKAESKPLKLYMPKDTKLRLRDYI